jgi:hypothetical protein
MSVLNIAFASLGRAAALGNMVLTVYVIHLLLALPLTMAFHRLLGETTNFSLEYDTLLQGFQFTVLSEFLNAYGPAIVGLMHGGFVLALVAVLVNTFLSGGILTVLGDRGRPFSLRTFFRGCGEEFPRFAGVLAVTGVGLLVVGSVLALLLGLIIGAVSSGAETEVPVIAVVVVGTILFLLGILAVLLAGDYARVLLVVQKGGTVLDAAWKSVRFVLRHLSAVTTLVFIYICTGAILFVLVTIVWSVVGTGSSIALLVTVVLQQGFIVLRGWLRIGSYAGAVALYRDRASTSLSDLSPAHPPDDSGGGRHNAYR